MKLKTHGDNINEVIFSNGNSLLFSYETPQGRKVVKNHNLN